LKKSDFKPPIRSPWIKWIFVWLNRFIFSSDVTWKIDEVSFLRWKAIPKKAGVLVAVKHAHQSDEYFLFEISARLGQDFYYVSVPEVFNHHGGLDGWFARRFGAFPVERGGRNVEATRFIVETLLHGTAQIVIFPEGELFYLNDVVTPLKPGTAFFALEGAKARANAGKRNSMFILPIGIKYFYPKDISLLLHKTAYKLEKKLFGKSFTGDILSRIQRMMEKVLQNAESQFKTTIEGKSHEERFWVLSRILVEQFEKEENMKTISGDLSDRARYFLEKFRFHPEKYQRAFWALYSLSFFPGYLEKPTQERIMETLRKLERLITGNETPGFPGHKVYALKVQESILVDEYLPQYLKPKGKKEAIQALTYTLQKSLQDAVDALIQEAQKL
jgi:1-acyl-sn-glycerol-3-phosphate acyltransferase